jgi:hypothetical protein
MRKAIVTALQTRLKELGLYTDTIDGERGRNTHAAADKALAARPGDLPADYRGWSDKRKTIAFLQLWCRDRGIDAGTIDGQWGPTTDFAAETLLTLLETGAMPPPWRDVPAAPGNPNGWPKDEQGSLMNFYGPHGGFNNAAHPPPPLVKVPSPWPFKIAWNLNQTRRHLWAHKKVADSLAQVLERVHEHYGPAEIERLRLNIFSGDYSARRRRGGTAVSTHAWGIAYDFDDTNNQLRWNRDRARLARPEYDDWWTIWEREGWVSLGRAKNFDWMHVQAARL